MRVYKSGYPLGVWRDLPVLPADVGQGVAADSAVLSAEKKTALRHGHRCKSRREAS